MSTIAGNPKATYKVVNKLLDKEYGRNKLPNGESDVAIANDLKNFFHSKTTSIYKDIKDSLETTESNIKFTKKIVRKLATLN